MNREISYKSIWKTLEREKKTDRKLYTWRERERERKRDRESNRQCNIYEKIEKYVFF